MPLPNLKEQSATITTPEGLTVAIPEEQSSEDRHWFPVLNEALPDFANDIKSNFDSVIHKSSLQKDVIEGCVVSAAMSIGNNQLLRIIVAGSKSLNDRDYDAACTASLLAAQDNMWYSYIESSGDQSLKAMAPKLNSNSSKTYAGTSRSNFEAYMLAASIVNKCDYSIRTHNKNLMEEGYKLEQLRDIARIVATINAIAKVLG